MFYLLKESMVDNLSLNRNKNELIISNLGKIERNKIENCRKRKFFLVFD